MRFRKIYLEISNVCNLRCRFCPGTRRAPRVMTEPEFACLLPKLRPYTDFLYFHLMGEPLAHPLLPRFLELADQQGFRVILTTNGTRLAGLQEELLAAPGLHKVNISLHSFEANDTLSGRPISMERYLQDCFAFGRAAVDQGAGKIVVYRLWNEGGQNELNEPILEELKRFFPEPWVEERKGTRLADRVYLEYGDKFEWPDLKAEERNGARRFCYGLRDQLGVLADGTVVPCCLDHEGDLALGNLFEQDLDVILDTPRARKIYEGFTKGEAAEELCRRCGYADRFSEK